MTDERMAKLMKLREVSQASPDVRRAMMGAVARAGVESIGHLAEEKPEVFDEIADGLLGMVDELPWV